MSRSIEAENVADDHGVIIAGVYRLGVNEDESEPPVCYSAGSGCFL